LWLLDHQYGPRVAEAVTTPVRKLHKAIFVVHLNNNQGRPRVKNKAKVVLSVHLHNRNPYEVRYVTQEFPAGLGLNTSRFSRASVSHSGYSFTVRRIRYRVANEYRLVRPESGNKAGTYAST
jgi:hypothetical protein